METENLVGLFVNTVVLRVDLTGEPSFATLLDRARGVIAEALEHKAMPLQKVIEVLTPKRYPGHNAVFSVNFIYQRSFIENTDYGTFRLVDLPSWSAGAMHDLNFFMVERPEGWRLSCEYNAGLYLQASIERLLRHFVNILSAISADPMLPVASIPILDASERHHVVVECNDTAAAYPRDLTLPHLFARQAAETPGAIAVVAGAQSLTYRDVKQRSDALAQQLIRLGVGPNARVGVFVKRTVDLVIAPLAILKAGNAYVPLDPTYPHGRLTQIIEQSGLVAIVAQSAVVPPPLRSVPIVAIGSTFKPAATANIPELPSIRPEDTAYVIFTSGSTGQPKGVQIPHGALTNFLCAMRGVPGFTAQDTIVAVTTICFDIATLEIFLPLTLGAKVVIAAEEETRDGQLLLSLLKRAGARVLQATPATWELLIEAGWSGDPQLRMLCGGEALPRHLADRLLDRSPELWNMYGPTETTIWSSAKRITRGEGPVLIGPPIANTQFYIVDRNGELVPHGGVGELMIGGDGVADGYWHMAALTSERFPADRFRDVPSAKLYRTGDLVRMRQDREFQYLGRTDQQIKLRGFRIELGEIEAVLLRHGAVRHAIAITGESASGEIAIFAYVELRGDVSSPPEQIVDALRADVAAMLPGYMRPRDIMVVDAVPLLPNGKIDRKALPLPGSEEQAERSRFQPLNDLETRIAQIWCEILGVESVNASADFFKLGGHSLLAARLLARVEAVFGHRISMSTLFEFAGLHRVRGYSSLPPSAELRLPPGCTDGTTPCGAHHLRHQQHRHFRDAVTAPQGRSVDHCAATFRSIVPKRQLASYGRGNRQSIRALDPGNSAQRPLRADGMVQWRYAGLRDSPSAPGGPRGGIARLSDRHMDSRLLQTARLASIETRGLLISVGADPDRLGQGAIRAKIFLALRRQSSHRAPFLWPPQDRGDARRTCLCCGSDLRPLVAKIHNRNGESLRAKTDQWAVDHIPQHK